MRVVVKNSTRSGLQRALRSLGGLALVLILTAPSESAEQKLAKTGKTAMKFQISSPAFEYGQKIPKQYTGDGKDLSPPLKWTDPPEETQSFALICDDPDAPVGDWVHWIVYGLPGSARELKEGIPAGKQLPDGAKQGANSWGKTAYGGPAPPPGKPHRYFFKLYALDRAPDLDAGASKKQVLDAIESHTLAEAQTMGTYQR